MALLGAAMAGAVVASSISPVRRRPVPSQSAAWWSGLGLIWIGAAVNRVARHQLGRAYRSELTVVSDHEVVTGGLYRFVRHPMYSGTTLICAGASVAVASTASLAWVLPVSALVHRIRVEERMLRRAVGDEYERFSAGWARLVPSLW